MVAALALGAAVATVIAAFCPPCAPIATQIAAVLGLTAALVFFIDSPGGFHGVYIEGYIPGPQWIWHN